MPQPVEAGDELAEDAAREENDGNHEERADGERPGGAEGIGKPAFEVADDDGAKRRRKSSNGDHLEIPFARAAIGAHPVVRNVFPLRARRNAFLGQAPGFVIDEAAQVASIAFHIIPSDRFS